MSERAKLARSPSRYVTPEQMTAMLDFMAQHVDFATGSLRAMRFTSRKLWADLARTLNNSPSGAKKTADGWSREQTPPVVKLEAAQVSPAIYVTKAWTVTTDTNVEKESDGDNESNGSADSNGEFDADDDDAEEPIIHGIYPKWLVAIEKKRAEGDFIKAKAEELRASAAAKNAKAALLQAEALKKLADAAQIQAEAIMKIALALESRSRSDNLLPI